jgi:hypothetical protein
MVKRREEPVEKSRKQEVIFVPWTQKEKGKRMSAATLNPAYLVVHLVGTILWAMAWYKHGKTKCGCLSPRDLEDREKTAQGFFIAWGVLFAVGVIILMATQNKEA